LNLPPWRKNVAIAAVAFCKLGWPALQVLIF
jgi:hypothetical protein